MKFAKRSLCLKLLCLCALLAFAAQANALTIDPSTTPQWSGNQTSQSEIDDYIAAIIGASSLLYKSDEGVPPVESGPLKDSYETVFDPPGDPEDATITWNGPGIVGPTAYLLVKDGAAIPAWYLFNLTALDWDGMEILELQDFWPGTGAISHVSLYGTQVPEPAAMFFLAASLLGLAGVGRNKFKK